MTVLLYLAAACFLGSALLPVITRWALATIKPSAAVPLLVAGSVAVAFGLGIALSSLAISVLAGWGPIAREGGVSATVLRAVDPVPFWLGIVAAAAVMTLLGRAVLRTVAAFTQLCRSSRLCRRLPGSSPVVFTEIDDIVTLAGFRGRIIVGTALFDQLEPQDKRVVLAHEFSHLRRQHHWYVQAVEIAAAANPMLLPLRPLVRLGVERWADEDAAGINGVADRQLAAHALARVALRRQHIRDTRSSRSSRSSLPALPGSLAAATLMVSTRVTALLQPERPSRTGRVLLIGLVSVAVLVAGIYGLAHANEFIEIAQAGPRRH